VRVLYVCVVEDVAKILKERTGRWGKKEEWAVEKEMQVLNKADDK